MAPLFFEKQADFRKWLERNHNSETELWVGFYKVNSGKESMTWSQSVDEALCFGWIDGVRKSIDKDSYQIRFTKRRPDSIWSTVNIKKMEVLKKEGLMKLSGLAIFESRIDSKSKMYSHEKEEIQLPTDFEKLFKSNHNAWVYFQSLAKSYKKASLLWVMGAKQKRTQLKRLNEIIEDSEKGINQWKDNKYKK